MWLPGGRGSSAGGVCLRPPTTASTLWYSSKCHSVRRKSNACVCMYTCQAFTHLYHLLIIPGHAEILNIHEIVTKNSASRYQTKKCSALELANTEYHMIVFRSLGDILSFFPLIISLLAVSRTHEGITSIYPNTEVGNPSHSHLHNSVMQ